MILLWGIGILVLLLMLHTSHQETSMSLLEPVLNALVTLPVIGDNIQSWLETTDGNYNTDDIRHMIFSAWGLLSLLLMMLDILRRKYASPSHTRNFKQRHLRLLGALLLLALGYLMVYWSTPEQYNGSGWGWVGLLGAYSLILYCVSLYAMALGYLSRKWLP